MVTTAALAYGIADNSVGAAGACEEVCRREGGHREDHGIGAEQQRTVGGGGLDPPATGRGALQGPYGRAGQDARTA
ncbi:hypothetical protein [Streptomyces violascens]|uniref:hypothetical protein n=1 Tax=Streptomyces violascens TaxID=67381 RepID=UPI00369ECDA7